MGKKQRRKRSKPEIREVWREQNRKEQRTKEQPNREQREKEQREKEQRKKTPPPHPGDIASVKPSRYEAWCSSCRAHTRSKSSTRRWRRSNGESASATTWTCLHCRGTSFVPFERQYWAFVVAVTGFILASCAVIALAALFVPAFFELNPSGYWLLVFSLLLTVGLGTRLMYRITRYRDWSQWAKEQKANKPS